LLERVEVKLPPTVTGAWRRLFWAFLGSAAAKLQQFVISGPDEV